MRKSWQLDRRTFLRGGNLPGITMAQWNGMEPSKGKTFPGCVFLFPLWCSRSSGKPSFTKKALWFPTGEGENFEFTGLHDKLVPFRNKLTFFGGVQHPNPGVNGHGAGSVYLTSANLAGQNYRQSVSVDQVAAEVVRKTYKRFLRLS